MKENFAFSVSMYVISKPNTTKKNSPIYWTKVEN